VRKIRSGVFVLSHGAKATSGAMRGERGGSDLRLSGVSSSRLPGWAGGRWRALAVRLPVQHREPAGVRETPNAG
ncbi:MAG: hypothetical protein ACXVX6_07505, partial [Mycobacterium sp.]